MTITLSQSRLGISALMTVLVLAGFVPCHAQSTLPASKPADKAEGSPSTVEGRIRGADVKLKSALFKDSMFFLCADGPPSSIKPGVRIDLRIDKGIIPENTSFLVKPETRIGSRACRVQTIFHHWKPAATGRRRTAAIGECASPPVASTFNVR